MVYDDEKHSDGLVKVASNGNGRSVTNVPVAEIETADDFLEAAAIGTEREHTLTFREALRLYPGAFFWAIAVSFTIVMDGFDLSIISSFMAYPEFAKKFGDHHPGKNPEYLISTKWNVTLSNVGIIGNFFGLTAMGILTPIYGHRVVMMGTLLLMVAFNFLPFFAPNIEVLTAGQALQGVTVGLFGIMGSVYASEVAPLPLRGFLTSFVNICWVIGQIIFAGVLVGLTPMHSEWAYRIPLGLVWFWPIPLFAVAYYCPDSPYWCVAKGKYALAEKNLHRLSSGSTDDEIRRSLAMFVHTNKLEKAQSKNASIWECFKGTNLRRTEIACMVLSSQAWCGQVFAYGSTYFFIIAGFNADNAYKLNFGSTAVAFVGTVGAWILMVYFGRRPLIIWGYTAMTICLILVGGLAFKDTQGALWAQAALTVLWLFFYSLGMGPQTFSLASEVSATRLRPQTLALGRFSYHLARLITNTVQPYLINPESANLKGKTALVWVGTSVINIIWCWFRMPETKGITYAEMDILFEKKTPAWKFKSTQVDVIDDRHD
ncbi:hypothetical protein VHUM_04190 [Vanrija humicola]|uniref:Major facilitator superfamily (MFS) profile domain-containing protein n=1 Tax=Vanrija humicola TaxID=5417 RepID=A0A7D8YUF0_VANHU|nr:hypothetical protein VHUM_04190 [Vanrija humicola]